MANIQKNRELMVEQMNNLKQPNLIKEGKLTKLTLFALRESEDGRFYNISPEVLIQAPNLKVAEKLADEYTKGQYSKYRLMFELKPETIKVYK